MYRRNGHSAQKQSFQMPNFLKEILMARICQPPHGLYRSLGPWEPSLGFRYQYFSFFLLCQKASSDVKCEIMTTNPSCMNMILSVFNSALFITRFTAFCEFNIDVKHVNYVNYDDG